jgi:hypothetical protein
VHLRRLRLAAVGAGAGSDPAGLTQWRRRLISSPPCDHEMTVVTLAQDGSQATRLSRSGYFEEHVKAGLRVAEARAICCSATIHAQSIMIDHLP